MAKKKQLGTASTIGAAATALSIPPAWVKMACDSGCGRTPGGRIDIAKIKGWVEAHAKDLDATKGELGLKDQLLVESIRMKRLRNEVTAGKLVERAWVVERFQRVGGEFNAIRVRSEAEDALLFASAAGDVGLCRSVLKGIWDRLFESVQGCAKHFQE